MTPTQKLHKQMAAIVARASDETGVSESSIHSPSRLSEINDARQFSWKLCREAGISYERIARYFSRDRSTVMSGVKSFDRRMANV